MTTVFGPVAVAGVAPVPAYRIMLVIAQILAEHFLQGVARTVFVSDFSSPSGPVSASP